MELAQTTVLIGENNAGKTALLDAVRKCLRELGTGQRLVFEPYDFHLEDDTTEPAAAEPIQITLHFVEAPNRPWAMKVKPQLQRLKVLQLDQEDRSCVIFRLACKYDLFEREFKQEWSFLTPDGQSLTGISDLALKALQGSANFFFLGALRDAAEHFDAKGRFWRPFLKDSQMTPEAKTDIEGKLKEVNELIVQSHGSFDVALNYMKRVQEVVPIAGGDVVGVEAVPGRIFDMLSKAQVHMNTTTGAKIPMNRHGDGMQSLAVLMLFQAFLAGQSEGTSSIVALEEPEAHLHPSAVRALWRLVQGIPGQILISTHSGDLLSEVEPSHIRRLVRATQGVICKQLVPNVVNDQVMRKFLHHVRRERAELLFARCWMLVEGESEVWVYSASARALGIDLHREGIAIVEHRRCDLNGLLPIADTFGIQWFAVLDGDGQGVGDAAKVRKYLNGRDFAKHAMQDYPDIERHLIENGFHDVYENCLGSNKRAELKAGYGEETYYDDLHTLYKKNGPKTEAAFEAATEIELRGKASVTATVRSVLERAITLAKAGA